MSDETCLDHDERKLLDENNYPYCLTCKHVAAAVRATWEEAAKVAHKALCVYVGKCNSSRCPGAIAEAEILARASGKDGGGG